MAQGTVTFDQGCEEVSGEIQARVNGQDGWKDPHNRGNYAMQTTAANMLRVKRRTGNNKYTDVISFAMSAADNGGCKVKMCSVSLANSNNDEGTNMCNMGNLFCNTSIKNNQNGVACASINSDL